MGTSDVVPNAPALTASMKITSSPTARVVAGLLAAAVILGTATAGLFIWQAARPQPPDLATATAAAPRPATAENTLAPAAETPAAEVLPVTIPLNGPISRAEAEISGMAWYGDWLILLPQYPQRFQNQLYAVARQDILAYLDQGAALPPPQAIPFDSAGLEKSIPGFQGFEAIAVVSNATGGDQVFLTIEAESGKVMGYLVQGQIAPDLSSIRLDAQLAEIAPQAALSNMSDESLLLYRDQIFTFYEANGALVNLKPQAHVFDLSLKPQDSFTLTNVEYRITDAAPPDAEGRFWAINYLYPGDAGKLHAGQPSGEVPASHQQFPQVERLLQFQIQDGQITLSATPPVWLLLENEDARNWEALALLEGRGFLIATDKFPLTILAFVPYSFRP